jgi:hypothetical protein
VGFALGLLHRMPLHLGFRTGLLGLRLIKRLDGWPLIYNKGMWPLVSHSRERKGIPGISARVSLHMLSSLFQFVLFFVLDLDLVVN